MQMLQREGGESINDEDGGRRRSGAWLSDGRRGNVCFVFTVMCVLQLVYQARVLL